MSRCRNKEAIRVNGNGGGSQALVFKGHLGVERANTPPPQTATAIGTSRFSAGMEKEADDYRA